jgi:nucleoside-diphosphate-sugar epimerase
MNRGVTPDELPRDVERLRADRADPNGMRRAIGGRQFGLVLDTTTYKGADAHSAIDLFAGRVDRYVFVSSGQVYLVREGITRPFREEDYEGPVLAAPPRESKDHDSWSYGIGKREAEDEFAAAFDLTDFPVTTLRLPMVASERDHYGRIQAYIARMLDGGPILVPDEAGLPLRHVYVGDVARLVVGLIGTTEGIGRAYNISCGKSMSLEEFLSLLARLLGQGAEVTRVPRRELEARDLLPDCSPFSGRWMSELDNSRSLAALRHASIGYTSPENYLPLIIADYKDRWRPNGSVPSGYEQRRREQEF